MGSACDWLKQIFLATRPIRSLTQIWLVTRHQYGISALVPQTSFRWETSDGLAKCRQFSQAVKYHKCSFNNFPCYHNWKLRALFYRTRSRDLKIIKWLPRRIKNNYECALLQRELGVVDNTQYGNLYQMYSSV